MIFLLLACSLRNPVPDAPGPFHDGSPTIQGVQWGCDVDSAEWTFRLRTQDWTGGATLWLARTIDDIEKHPIASKSADPNGEWDCLQLTLDVVADWRDASAGSSTRWRCDDADQLSFQIQVEDPRGEQATDCRTWGAWPRIWNGTDEVPDCSHRLQLPVDTGDTGSTGAGEVEACN